uniref:E2 domain-containing protein n=1 Tax=Ditylenchus dipsaci TaxID=166011 RepID=A0A915D8M3_9BILA
MKEKDPKGAEEYKREMTSKFRKTIEDVHDERVQASLNEKKRQATHDYRAALAVQVGNSNKNNVLRTLKNYIKAEEKDRSHMLNRYRHLLRSDPEQAISFEPVLLHRLRYIDLRINGTLAMLRDFPELEKQVRPVAVSFWNDFRRDNTPEVTNDEPSLLGAASERKATSPSTTTTSSTTARPSTPPVIHHVVALKDVLSEKDEDSDEDQFDDNEESDSSSDSSSSTSKKLAIDVKLKPLSSQKGVEKPAKVGGEDDDQEEGEYTESNDKKEPKDLGELSVAIEPIVSAPARRIQEELDESPPAYARQDVLMMANRDDEFSEQNYISNYATRTNFAIAVFACAFIVLAAGLFVKRRSRHPGFIEVDVCTPDDRHVEGLKVNGYENPPTAFSTLRREKREEKTNFNKIKFSYTSYFPTLFNKTNDKQISTRK